MRPRTRSRRCRASTRRAPGRAPRQAGGAQNPGGASRPGPLEDLDGEVVDLDGRQLGAVVRQLREPDHQSARTRKGRAGSSPRRAIATQSPSRKIQPARFHGVEVGQGRSLRRHSRCSARSGSSPIPRGCAPVVSCAVTSGGNRGAEGPRPPLPSARHRAQLNGRRGASPSSIQARTRATRRNGPVARRSSRTRRTGQRGPSDARTRTHSAEEGQAQERPHGVGDALSAHGASLLARAPARRRPRCTMAAPRQQPARKNRSTLRHVVAVDGVEHGAERRVGGPAAPWRRTRPAPRPRRAPKTTRPRRGQGWPGVAGASARGRVRRGQRTTTRTARATMGTAGQDVGGPGEGRGAAANRA